MNMNRRLVKIEERLNMNKEANCDLEMHISVNDSLETEATYFKICPDGKRTVINSAQAMRLMNHDKGTCEVEFID